MRCHLRRVLFALAFVALLVALGAVIWMIWATALAEDGHKFDATELPSAVTWTSLLVAGGLGLCGLMIEEK